MYGEHRVATLSLLGCELRVGRLVDVQGREGIVGTCADHFISEKIENIDVRQ